MQKIDEILRSIKYAERIKIDRIKTGRCIKCGRLLDSDEKRNEQTICDNCLDDLPLQDDYTDKGLSRREFI